MNNNTEEIEIDLGALLQVIWGKWYFILLAAILCAQLTFAYARFVLPKQYESTTQIYVINKQNDNNTLTYTDLQTGNQLTKDYIVLVKSRAVVEQVIRTQHLEYDYKAFCNKMTVETPTDTRILSITIEDEDPYMAMRLAEAVRDAAEKHILSVCDVERVNIAEKANLPLKPSSPDIKKWIMIGFALGFILACGGVVVDYLLNDRIQTPDDIEKYLGLSNLGAIPLIETEDTKRKKRFRGKITKRK